MKQFLCLVCDASQSMRHLNVFLQWYHILGLNQMSDSLKAQSLSSVWLNSQVFPYCIYHLNIPYVSVYWAYTEFYHVDFKMCLLFINITKKIQAKFCWTFVTCSSLNSSANATSMFSGQSSKTLRNDWMQPAMGVCSMTLDFFSQLGR